MVEALDPIVRAERVCDLRFSFLRELVSSSFLAA